MVSIHGPLGYEPNTLTTAPLRCLQAGECQSTMDNPSTRHASRSGILMAPLPRGHLRGRLCSRSQFARVVKGVDLRSTAGNCAQVRTPQLTHCLGLQTQPRSVAQVTPLLGFGGAGRHARGGPTPPPPPSRCPRPCPRPPHIPRPRSQLFRSLEDLFRAHDLCSASSLPAGCLV